MPDEQQWRVVVSSDCFRVPEGLKDAYKLCAEPMSSFIKYTFQLLLFNSIQATRGKAKPRNLLQSNVQQGSHPVVCLG